MKNTISHPGSALRGSQTVLLLCALLSGVAIIGARAADTPASATPVAVPSGSNAPLSGLSVAAGAGADTSHDVVAHVNGREITVKDLRETIGTLAPAEQAAIASNPALLKQVVMTLLYEPILLKEMDDKKWDQSPEVKAHLARVIQTAKSDLYLTTITTPPADYPNDAELKRAYEARKDSYAVPHQFHIWQVRIALPADADQAAIDKAQKKLGVLIDALKDPKADLAAIARAQSDDPKGAEAGGDMGWVADTNMPQVIRARALMIPKNTFSAPVRLQDGLHIFKVLDTKDVSPLSLEDVRDSLTRQ
ncbi:MAG TPA: peptidylprolyl isomerase, partial [Chthoniobacteraceae bacterium]|nr:peptidylprolyl isomerase [Chthoniobacteraceae bacterium]